LKPIDVNSGCPKLAAADNRHITEGPYACLSYQRGELPGYPIKKTINVYSLSVVSGWSDDLVP